MENIAIVTGASGGIGAEVCRSLVACGYTVYGLSRSGKAPKGVISAAVDVSDDTAIAVLAARVVAECGQIDLLVNNAGMGISGPVEMTPQADVRAIFDVNFFGTLNCINACLPYMRAAGRGRIVNVSSVAAIVAIPYQAFYSATKAAINSLTLALRNETAHTGVTVTAVMPGDAHTGFTSARRRFDGGEAYPNSARAVAAMERDEMGGMTPGKVAAVVCRAALSRHPRSLYIAGGKYKAVAFLLRLLPTNLANRLVGRIYG